MKSTVSRSAIGLFFLLSAMSSLGDVTQQDTTQPDSFSFTQNTYVVGENATHAIITVTFNPGSRGSTGGGCGYRTEDLTALAGEDYLHVEGGLAFGWPYFRRSFNVPIIWDDLNEADQTVRLRILGHSYSPTAILRITNVPPPLRLRLEPAAGGAVAISWPGNHPGALIEQSANPLSGQWSIMTNAPVYASGRFFVTNNAAGPAIFYRLRKE